MNHYENVLSLFPVLKTLGKNDLDGLFNSAYIAKKSQGNILLREGQTCENIPLVLSGVIRIYKISPSGRELTIFRAKAGDTCLVSLACRLKGEDFPAIAENEVDTTMFMIPLSAYNMYLNNHLEWKDFLITTLYDRMIESMQVVQSIAFDSINKRIGQWMIVQMDKFGSNEIHATHETIAAELGTAREVVSRVLGELKDIGVIVLSRGKIKVIDLQYIKSISD